MRLKCTPEPVPELLRRRRCPACSRLRIPYLPSCACGHVFDDRRRERKRPAAFDDAPLGEGMARIAHLSDIHIGSKTPEGRGVDVRLRALFAVLHRLDVRALIVSGDLTRFGQAKELERIRSLFAAGGYEGDRLLVVPGNHDIPRGKDATLFSEVFGVTYPVIRFLVPGVQVLAFDSNILQERTLFERRWVPVRGRIGPEALEKAKAALAEAQGETRLLVLHHHISRLPPESPWAILDDYTFKSDRRLMTPLMDADAVIQFAHDHDVRAILHGHKHWYSRTGYRVGAIPVFNAGSIYRMIHPTFRIFDFREGEWVGLHRVEVLE